MLPKRIAGHISRFQRAVPKLEAAKTPYEFIETVYDVLGRCFTNLGRLPQKFLPKGQTNDSPFPLPFVHVPSLPRKGKMREKGRIKQAQKRMLNLCILFINGMALDDMKFTSLCVYRPTRLQKRFLEQLEGTVDCYVSDLETLVWPVDLGQHGQEAQMYAPQAGSKAEPINNSLLDLPEEGGEVDLVALARKLNLEDVVRWIEDPPLRDVCFEDLPRSTLMAEDWAEVVDRATNAGLVHWEKIENIHTVKDSSGIAREVLNGSFAVPKAKSLDAPADERARQRWISNLVASNECFRWSQLPNMLLPTIKELLSIRLRCGDEVKVSKSDVRNAFFAFSASPLKRFFALIPPAPGTCRTDPSTETQRFVPTMGALPMGWGGSVNILQRVMFQLVLDPDVGIRDLSAAFSLNSEDRKENLMTGEGGFSGTVLDDFFLLTGSGLKASALHSRVMMDLRKLWCDHGIPIHPKKEHVYSSDMEVVGIRLRKNFAERHAHRRFAVFTDAVRQLGRFSNQRGARASCLGKTVNGALLCRPLLSCFENWECYEEGGGPRQMMKWTEDSWSELLAGVVLLTLSRHQLDRALSGRMYASDACHEGGAAGGGLAYAEFKQHELEPVLTDLMLQRGWCKKELDDFVAAGKLSEEQVDQKVRLIEYFDPAMLYSRHWSEAMSTRYESDLHITDNYL